MNLEHFPTIALFNANPITLLGRGIQCIYEGSFAWLAIATHPLFAGDYYMEDHLDFPLKSLPAPPLQTPFPEQKLIAPSTGASTLDVAPPPTFNAEDHSLKSLPAPPLQTPFPEQKLITPLTAVSTPNVAPPPILNSVTSPLSVAPAAPLPPAFSVAAEPSDVTPTLETPDVVSLSEKPLQDRETEDSSKKNSAFLQYWTSRTEDSSPVPDTTTESPSITSTVPTPPTLLSTCQSEASTLPPYVPHEDTAQTPHEELVHLLNLPSLPLEHASWPEQSEQYLLPPLKSSIVFPGDSETSKPLKRRSRKFDLDHILNPEPKRRTKRHSSGKESSEKAIDELDETNGPSGRDPTVRFRSTTHPYHHHDRRCKSRRKDRIYDRGDVDADLEAPSPERRDESPPRRSARPPTPHPRHRELSSTEEQFYAESGECLNRVEEQLLHLENTLRDLKAKQAKQEHHSSEGQNNIHDVRKKERKERRKAKKERRSAPYGSRPIARSEFPLEDREPPWETRRSKTLERDSSLKTGREKPKKTRKRGSQQGLDDVGTLGLGALSLCQLEPEETRIDAGGSHPVQPSALSELDTFQQAGLSEAPLELGSLAAALPTIQQLNDGELIDLLQSVHPSVGQRSSEDQPPSAAQTAEGNQHRSDVEELSNNLTQIQVGNEALEQEQTQRPLTIKIPSMARLQAQIAARNATAVADQ